MTARLHDYADDAARRRAFLERDPAADGMFCVAVLSTGIYCRPTCPARRPREERVRFFPDPGAAEAAGFRPCRRCRPHQVSPQQRLVAHTLALLEQVEGTAPLAALAAEVGVHPLRLQRAFRWATGLTPHDCLSELRGARLRQRLREGAPVTQALYDAGYGSSRALYERAALQLGMTPGAYRRGGAGVRIAYGRFPSPLGAMVLAATDRGLCALHFDDGDPEGLLRREFPRAELAADPAAVAPWAAEVLAYLRGERTRLDLPLDLHGTDFQRRVWEALRRIPYGETWTYAQVAQAIGRPQALRAVARACAANPLCLVIPCHRVIGASGALRGYRWGVARKRALLALERQGVSGSPS